MQNARRAARRIVASLTISLLLGGLSTQAAAAQGSPRVTGPVYVAVEVPAHEPTPQPMSEGGGGVGRITPYSTEAAEAEAAAFQLPM